MEKFIDLDQCVINALNFLKEVKLPELNLTNFRRPLVVGSGNSVIVGKIMFENYDAVFADESNYLDVLERTKDIDGAILISAFGGKDAPLIAKNLKMKGLRTFLITDNSDALAKKFVDNFCVFPKNTEPYTYNTSTYFGMILGKTREDPEKILDYIIKAEKKIRINLRKYDSFFFILPQKFDSLREMFITKFDELFGARISARVYTSEQAKHAKTIVPYDKELFIGLGYENKLFGKNRLNLSIPKDAGYVLVLALGYYIIGNIQKQNKPYFKENIEKYVKKSSKIFGQKIKSIVV